MHNDLVDIQQIYHVDNMKSVEYEDEDFYVYVHFRNDTGAPFYVGKGRGNRAFQTGSRRSEWWRNIVKKCGYTVKVVKNFQLNEEASFGYEKELIAILRSVGFELVNLTDGGEGAGGYKFTEERKQKHSELAKIAMNRPEVRAKSSESNSRPEVRARKSAAAKLRVGEKHNRYLGYSVGTNEKQVVILAGYQEMKDYNFDQGTISKCIAGKLRTHKGFTWTRQQNLNPNDFVGLEPYDQRSAERLKNAQ